MARENSSRVKHTRRANAEAYRSSNLPSEVYQAIGGTKVCSHGIDIPSHPEHNCLEYENAKRAARGAPPLEHT